MLGDCLEKMKEIPDESVDMVLADPPYGTTSCKWDSVIPFEPMWAGIKHCAKRNAAIVLTASQPFTSALVMSNVAMFRHEWVWIKNRGSNFLNCKREPMKEHESVLVFSCGGWHYAPIMQERTGRGLVLAGTVVVGAGTTSETINGGVKPKAVVLPAMRLPSSWQKFNTESGVDKFHPVQKPVPLMEYLIKTYTKEGDTVLDFTMGAGTTGVACKNLKRNFIGIEKDENYFNIAKNRIESVSEG
jgi:site-specific DNA-methyltransferase (adenine-specific)